MTTPEAFPEPNNAFAICAVEPLDQLEQLVVAERQHPESTRLVDLERTLRTYQDRIGTAAALRVDKFEMGRMRKLLARFTSRVPRVFLVPAPFYDPTDVQIPPEFRVEFARALNQLAAEVPGVAVLPYLSPDCSMMMDTVHLNLHGGEIFSAFLREHIEAALAAGGTPSGKAGGKNK
ncbi:MAG: hypothetical protein EXQ56_08485 [Acidobacteria bacterium]|nr:hypothetical protein [Acidobacteriota bacterium]